MSRPFTEASEYEPFLARLPKDVITVLRQKSRKTGAPINTELIAALRRGLRLPRPREEKEPLTVGA